MDTRRAQGPDVAELGDFCSLSHEFDSFDEFNQSIQGWATEFKQVDRGIATVRLRHRMTPLVNALDVSFTHSTASVGATPPGHRTFGMVDRDHGCTWCGRDTHPNQILRFDAHDEFFTFTPRGFIGRTFSVDETLLSAVAERLGYGDFLAALDRSGDILESDPEAMTRFRQLYDSPMNDESDLLDVAEGVVRLIAGSSNGPVVPRRRSAHLVDGALSYITAYAREAVTVADVCRALGVGYRTLDRAFSRHLGHGPKESILACRLNGVRAALRSSDPTLSVADVANAWGFWHLGDLARIYRREFGELPSETRSTVLEPAGTPSRFHTGSAG